ncbi:MAG: hypothetical protein ACYCXP_08305 [Leptospirillum sp.]
MIPRQISPCKNPSIPAMILAVAVFLSCAACGNGNMFNGVSGNGTGTLAGAESVAATDIKNSNYSAAISALQPYCPQNTCPDTTSAIILSDAYLATGTSSNVTTVAAIQSSSNIRTGLNQIASASLSGEDSNQILATLIADATGNPTANQTLTSISQAISCVTNNTCTKAGVEDLQAAIELLVNAGLTQANCQSGASSTCDAGLASMYMIDLSAYIMTAISYQSGLIYNTSLPTPAFELCTANATVSSGTAGTTGCNATLSASTINTDLGSNLPIVYDICNLLYNGVTASTSDPCGTQPGSISGSYTTVVPPGLVELLPTILSSLGASSAGQTVTNSAYEFLNTLLNCSTIVGGVCTSSTQTTAPTTPPTSSNILAIVSNYMAQI